MIAAIIALLIQGTVGAQPAPVFEPAACPSTLKLPSAKCGTVGVPENRQQPAGRRIALNIIVLASAGPARLPPLFDIDGGPGLPGTKNAAFYASNDVSKGRDVVLVDQRGTGRSNGLECPELAAVKPTEPMLPPAAVERCRDSLKPRADLRFYGTADAVADLDDVRRALGYAKIDIFGMSYGTTVALRYMRRFPDRVRAAVLMGTAPPDAMPPRQHAPAASRALDLMLADCAKDAHCAARFPTLGRDLAGTRERIAAADGVEAAELFMERVRTRMYFPGTRVGLPLAIDRAAKGDMSAIFPTASATDNLVVADGMFLAVTCSESFGLMDYPAAARQARATPFGDYRLRRQRDACSGWPRARVDPDHRALPTATKASVLIISGEMDPVTPPEWGDTVAAALPRSRHIVVPGSGHIFDGMTGIETCLDPLMIAFLDHGAPEKLDVSCVARMKAPAYILK